MHDTRNTRFFSKINKFYLGEKPENSKKYLMSANSCKDEDGVCARPDMCCATILMTSSRSLLSGFMRGSPATD